MVGDDLPFERFLFSSPFKRNAPPCHFCQDVPRAHLFGVLPLPHMMVRAPGLSRSAPSPPRWMSSPRPSSCGPPLVLSEGFQSVLFWVDEWLFATCDDRGICGPGAQLFLGAWPADRNKQLCL